MHIAFLILQLCSGGAERSTTSLANQMAKLGHRVTILALMGDGSFYPTEKVDVRFLKLPELPQGKSFSRLRAVMNRAVSLRRIVRELQPDILVGMSHIMSAYAAFCTKGTRTVSVGTERANPFVLYAGKAMNLLRKTTSICCDGFVCQTEKAKSFFPKSTQRKAAVIPNAVFNPLVFQTTVPTEREPVITALGRLDENKGFDVLIRAFAKLHGEFPNYTLRIFGEGASRSALRKLVDALSLTHAVSLPGVDEQAILQIARASVFVLSSRSEGMPNALIEAMAAGVPCVSTRCDNGPKELILDGVNGLLVAVDDENEMCDAICRILRNKELSESLSAQALTLRKTHGIEAITQQWLNYFGTLLI